MMRHFYTAAAALGLLAAAAVSLPAVSLAAGRSMLAWDGCAEYDGVVNKAFACDLNEGVERIYGSVRPPVSMESVTGVEIVLDMLTPTGTPLPDWWRVKQTGFCRQGALVATFDFTQEPPNIFCLDLWRGQAIGGITFAEPDFAGTPERQRIKLIGAVAPANARPVSSDSLYNVVMLTLDHSKSAGADSCAGCSVPACMLMSSFRLTQPIGVGDVSYSSFGEAFIVWQSPVANCPGPLPARNRTWGALKSLYR